MQKIYEHGKLSVEEIKMKDTYEKPLCVICVVGSEIGTDVVTTSYFSDPDYVDDPYDTDY